MKEVGIYIDYKSIGPELQGTIMLYYAGLWERCQGFDPTVVMQVRYTMSYHGIL